MDMDQQITITEIKEADLGNDNVQTQRQGDEEESNPSVSEILDFNTMHFILEDESLTSSESDSDIEILEEVVPCKRTEAPIPQTQEESKGSDVEIVDEIFKCKPMVPKTVNGRLQVFDESEFEKDEADPESGEDEMPNYTQEIDEADLSDN